MLIEEAVVLPLFSWHNPLVGKALGKDRFPISPNGNLVLEGCIHRAALG